MAFAGPLPAPQSPEQRPMIPMPTVRTFMDTETHALDHHLDVHEGIRYLIDHGVTGAPVVDGAELVGMFSEYECLRLLTKGTRDADVPDGTIGDFMIREFHKVTPEMDVYYIAGMFLADPSTRRFPVCEGGRLVGVITRKDVLRAVEHHFLPLGSPVSVIG